MSFVLAAPEELVTAASDLAGLGSTLTAAHAAAAAPTTGVLAAAADEVSTQIAALFSQHGLGFQQLSGQALEFHQRFVHALAGGASAYSSAETNAANALVNAVNTPAAAALGHPLIGNGASWMAAGGGGGTLGNIVSNAVNHMETAVLSNGAAGLLGTGGVGHLTSAGALLNPAAATNAATGAAVNPFTPIRDAIKLAYLAIEQYVRAGFYLAHVVTAFIPYVQAVSPLLGLYPLGEFVVRNVLFNTLDVLHWATPSVIDFLTATNASVDLFLKNPLFWLRSLFPPLPAA